MIELSGIYLTTSSSLIVRPAVSRVLAPLYGGLKHRDWAGLTDYTCPFGFAIGYVFDKQSDGPCHCDLPLPSTKSKTAIDTLSTKATGPNMPNSLNQFRLTRLGLLSQSTCVSSWYGFYLAPHMRFMGSRNPQFSLYDSAASYHYDPQLSRITFLSECCISKSAHILRRLTQVPEY